MTPSRGSAHQGVAARLTALFAAHILGRRLALYSPGVVTLPPLTQLEPDLLVVPPRFAPGTPLVEIAAPAGDVSVHVELADLFADIV